MLPFLFQARLSSAACCPLTGALLCVGSDLLGDVYIYYIDKCAQYMVAAFLV